MVHGALALSRRVRCAYEAFAAPIFTAFAAPAPVTHEIDVAQAVWSAVHDHSGKLHFPAVADAVALAAA
ncbi:MAG TPA: hypothetical protein PKY87_15195 [Terricaulis sp.]|nr:hypothetical protein [Terricaulis sp.]